MHQTIWKYPFEVTEYVIINMPEGAKVLDVQLQNGKPCLWALVNPGNPEKSRTFLVVATGASFLHVPGKHVGTFQAPEASEVWHVFEAP